MKKDYKRPMIKVIEVRTIRLMAASTTGVSEDGYRINHYSNFDEASIDDAS